MLQNYFFCVSYQRAKYCKSTFLVSHQRHNVFRITFFLVSYQRQKTFQNYFFINLLSSAELFFLVPSNAAKCFRITFLICYQRCYQQLFFFNSLLSTVFFLFLFNAAKCFRINFTFFLSTPQIAAEIVVFYFSSTQQSGAELLF